MQTMFLQLYILLQKLHYHKNILQYSPSEDKFYYDNGAKIRIQNISVLYGYKVFTARDINGKYRKITVDKWKRDNGYD